MSIQVLMPALSPTMSEGKLAKWHIKVGDKVTSGDLLAEIETDKATMEVEAIDEGIVACLLVESGSENVKVNTPILILAEEGENIDEVKQQKFANQDDANQDDNASKSISISSDETQAQIKQISLNDAPKKNTVEGVLSDKQ
ncbi:MAG: biotin/lipoyl-containing protein, partial [Pseudomonadota bacterium]